MKKLVGYLLVILLSAQGVYLGSFEAFEYASRAKARASRWWYEQTHRVVEVERQVIIETQAGCRGEKVRDIICRAARKSEVPVPLAQAVAMVEGGGNADNYQINCPAKWAARHDLRYCALGLFQIVPAMNDIEDPISLLGPGNLQNNVENGIKILRGHFDSSKGKDRSSRWYQALVRYYGAEADGYQQKIMAMTSKLALEMES